MTVKVVCTDRGQHARRLINYCEPGVAHLGIPDAAQHNVQRPDGGYTYRFVCTKCGRDAQLREENMLKVAQAGFETLDISRIP
ncbi:hypothetical protein M4V62_13005 [Streptomyces durmitorensis]|uniref:Uncharacterized protein n=1 Tax=Streptomyces durmitorensis TaxID=319947 RepID=A0ABY4PS82_9ACTN|nr:hypothetical protein [Streptomyces durmitorensis]UQT55945.1 hypothetical protein M4V62_13005 [Streptomyces durmitorensis]